MKNPFGEFLLVQIFLTFSASASESVEQGLASRGEFYSPSLCLFQWEAFAAGWQKDGCEPHQQQLMTERPFASVRTNAQKREKRRPAFFS
jgi:hypothetical protein